MAFQTDLIPPHSAVVLGLSGGPDSVFLLYQLAALRDTKHIKIIAAHLDHQWRDNSYKDEQFCRKLAQKLHVPYVSKKLTELGKTFKSTGSKEELGRQARRFFLEQVKKDHNANLIALAHHKDDQQETFFIRLIRGSSLSGLVGMRADEGIYIRPLLTISKTTILEYLNKHNIDYLIDPSNLSQEFLRNKIRQLVIPALQQSDSRFEINFDTTLKRLQEAEDFLKEYTRTQFNQISTSIDGLTYINISKFLQIPIYVQRRIIIYWLITQQISFVPTYRFLQEIIRFLQQPGSKEHRLHDTWSIIKQKKKAFIRKYKDIK